MTQPFKTVEAEESSHALVESIARAARTKSAGIVILLTAGYDVAEAARIIGVSATFAARSAREAGIDEHLTDASEIDVATSSRPAQAEVMGVRESQAGGHDPGRRTPIATIQEHRNFAVLLVTSVFGVAWAWERFRTVLGNPAGASPEDVASLALLIADLLFLVSWFYGSYFELAIADRLGAVSLVAVPKSSFALIVGAAAGLAVLGLASIDPLIFGSILLMIKVIELWSSWPLFRTVRQNVDDYGEHRLSVVQARGLEAVRTYYLERPWVQLSAAVIAVLGLVVGIGAFADATPDPSTRVAGRVATSIILIGVMAVQEGITWRWRRRYVAAVA